MRGKLWLFAVLLFILKPEAVQAQFFNCEKEFVAAAWQNTGQVLTAPICYKPKNWAWAGIGMGATALAFAYDGEWQNKLTSKPSAFAANLATYVGEPFGNPIYIGGFLALNYAVACRTHREKWAQLSAEALQSVVIASGITLVLKAGFHRVRPEEQEELAPYQFKGPSFRTPNMSFPSGHTTVAFALASSVSAYYNNKWYVAVPAFTLAGVSGWSRIYQQKHWPSDVVLGALIGTTVGYTLHNISRAKNRKLSFLVSPNFNGGASLCASFKLD
jgi:membrane-associated phospholipid phosphatase